MSDVTSKDVRDAVVPKSDQLNADDLIPGPMTCKVIGVRKGNKEQPIFIDFEGLKGRPYRPCKGMLRILISAWSDDPHEWVGRSMTLYRNPEVKYAGVKVGGIEISHLSDIPDKLEFMKTVSKGIKASVIVRCINGPTLTASDEAYVADATVEINEADTVEKLQAIAFVLKTKPDGVRAALRPVYDRRKKEIGE